jgi:beta-mannanase
MRSRPSASEVRISDDRTAAKALPVEPVATSRGPLGKFSVNRRRAAAFPLFAAAALLIAAECSAARSYDTATIASRTARTAASAKVDVGVTTEPLARNAWRAWTAADLQSVNQFEHSAHKHASVVMWYADLEHSQPDLAQLRAVAARGAIPEITLEPWDAVSGAARQPRYTLASIINGRHDGAIRVWARGLARFGRTVRLRFAQEMNGFWYPWAEVANGNRPEQFVQAWRHVHDIFKAAGATNVKWVWSPFAASIKAEEYPGSAYVDIMGLSGFNGGPELKWHKWQSFATIFGPAIAALTALAPDKPIELSEVGCSEQGGSKAAWITGLFKSLSQYPRVISLVWFNVDKESNWGIQSSARAERAFAAGVASSRFR